MTAQVKFQIRAAQNHIREVAVAVRHTQGLHDAAVVENPHGGAGGVGDLVDVRLFAFRRATEKPPRDHRNSLTMFSRYSWPPLARDGGGWASATFSSSANDALPARTLLPRSESQLE